MVQSLKMRPLPQIFKHRGLNSPAIRRSNGA